MQLWGKSQSKLQSSFSGIKCLLITQTRPLTTDEKKDPDRMTEPKCLHLQHRQDYMYTAADRYKYMEVVKQRYMYNYAEHS